jgi:LacI family transcriptional regulator
MKSQNKNTVGIKAIAEKANVSIGTVDRVIHNRGEVAKATKEKILKIIEEMEYTPNLLAQSLASKKKHIIAVLIPDSRYNNPYWKKPLTGIYEAAKEIKNFNFEISIFTYELGNEKSVTESAKELFKLQPDGLIFAPLMLEASKKVINQCQELDIPYVFIDVNIENNDNLAYFGQNTFQSGLVAARLLDLGLSEDADIHIIKLVDQLASSYHLNLRENGFLSYYEKAENKKKHAIRSIEIELSTKTSLNEEFDRFIPQSSSPMGIFVPNSKVHHVAKYLYENNRKNNLVIGYDLIEQNVEFLQKDLISFLICQNPEEQGYNSVTALFNYLALKRVPHQLNFSAIDIIVKENIDYYKNNHRD